MSSSSIYKTLFSQPVAARQAAFVELGAMNFSEYFAFLQAHTSNTPVVVDGVSVSNSLNKLLANRGGILTLQTKFRDVGSYWHALGLNPMTLSLADYEGGVSEVLGKSRPGLGLAGVTVSCSAAPIGAIAVNAAASRICPHPDGQSCPLPGDGVRVIPNLQNKNTQRTFTQTTLSPATPPADIDPVDDQPSAPPFQTDIYSESGEKVTLTNQGVVSTRYDPTSMGFDFLNGEYAAYPSVATDDQGNPIADSCDPRPATVKTTL